MYITAPCFEAEKYITGRRMYITARKNYITDRQTHLTGFPYQHIR